MTVARDKSEPPARDTRGTTRRELVLLFTVFVLAAAVPLTNAIFSLGIPLLRLEVGLLYAIVAAVAMLAALCVLFVGERIRTLLLALVVFAYVDTGYAGHIIALNLARPFVASGVISESSALVILFVLTIGVLAFVLWTVRKHAPVILAVAFGAALLSTLVLHGASVARHAAPRQNVLGAAPSTFNSTLPVTVFLLFDELGSVSALPVELRQTARLRKRILEFHSRHGFRLFDRVYSRHYWTHNSIPDLLNYEYKRTSRTVTYVKQEDDGIFHAGDFVSRYFEDMAKLGYRISVFETPHLDYCKNPYVRYCKKLDSFNPLSKYIRATWASRVSLLAGRTLGTIHDSYVVNMTLMVLSKLKLIPVGAAHLDALEFPLWFDRIERYILGAPRGSLIFAHVLVPHAPHVLDEQCTIRPNADTPYELASHHKPTEDLGKIRLAHYRRYSRQVACVYVRLERLLERASKEERLADAVFIISGDHGSRIAKSRFREEMDRQDYIDNYAAHFSVKSAGVTPGVDHTFIPLQRLFATLYGKDTEDDDVTCSQTVLAETHTSADFVVVDMPLFESHAGKRTGDGVPNSCKEIRKLRGAMVTHATK